MWSKFQDVSTRGKVYFCNGTGLGDGVIKVQRSILGNFSIMSENRGEQEVQTPFFTVGSTRANAYQANQ